MKAESLPVTETAVKVSRKIVSESQYDVCRDRVSERLRGSEAERTVEAGNEIGGFLQIERFEVSGDLNRPDATWKGKN